MRRAILFLVLAVAPALHAQTISPVIAEFGKKASGQFTVTNNALVPQAVIVEAQSLVGGQPRPLESGVDVKLSETSIRLGPKQSHTFDYDVNCSRLPCAVVMWATISGMHVTEGITLQIKLPHSVYICQKVKGCRASTRRAMGLQE